MFTRGLCCFGVLCSLCFRAWGLGDFGLYKVRHSRACRSLSLHLDLFDCLVSTVVVCVSVCVASAPAYKARPNFSAPLISDKGFPSTIRGHSKRVADFHGDSRVCFDHMLQAITTLRFGRSSHRLLGGSWVVINGVISKVTIAIVITPIRGLIITLILGVPYQNYGIMGPKPYSDF